MKKTTNLILLFLALTFCSCNSGENQTDKFIGTKNVTSVPKTDNKQKEFDLKEVVKALKTGHENEFVYKDNGAKVSYSENGYNITYKIQAYPYKDYSGWKIYISKVTEKDSYYTDELSAMKFENQELSTAETEPQFKRLTEISNGYDEIFSFSENSIHCLVYVNKGNTMTDEEYVYVWDGGTMIDRPW